MLADFTRRRILASASALALPSALHAQATLFDADVGIVGAGAAGLAAARECQRHNLSFVLLEARQRIGGRVFTDRSLGEPFDAGAVYIHFADRNPWLGIARDLGVETLEDKGGRGAFQLYDHGAKIERSPRRGAAFDRLSELFDTDDSSMADISLAERVAGEGEEVARAAGTMARMSLGEEPERVSAADYARLWSGDDFMVPGGYGDLVARYGAGLPVRLGVAVQAVDFSGQGVSLSTSAGTLRVGACIVTVSSGVLASGAIAFNPALPQATQDGIAGLGMGNLAKIALKFNGERFGLPEGADLFDTQGPRELFDFECWGFGRNLVVAYLGGDHARDVLGQGRNGAVAAALEVFCRIAGSAAGRACVGGAIANWEADPFSRGAYSHALPGQAGARAALAQPVAEKLWFAGEATGGQDFGGAMTAGGAFLAGQAAVRAIAAGKPR